ncbi:hypothetical protein SOV_17300 [Sporomusa ovata DSM 2662]|uniref:Terminase B protein, putative n=1 Tax=Sporomusa ovata TaxID=2378 RepID=A0A0U1KVH0_9FIRM|nr:hypothetical protein [Sporomusa ovata]EQB29330.1 hypothetical protein SOV_1c10630 [Sporomusa ovata DSM 2662]CQR71371.1 terminase B protein, putative [Sporomusa ovata]
MLNRQEAPISNEENELLEDIAGFELDPYGYVLYAYPWGEDDLADYDGPDVWQTSVLLDIGEKLQKGLLSNFQEVIREAVASGHGVGKSALVSWLVNWAMDTHEDTRGVITANTDTQLRTKTWPEIQKWSRMRITAHWTEVTATAIYSRTPGHESNWRIDAVPWSIAKPEAFAGLHNKGKRILMIFDEASTVDDKIWEVAEGAMTDENTQIIWCVFGNPTRNIGRFRECWRKFKKLWKTWQVDSREARMSNKHLIQEWIDTHGIDSDFIKIRVRGMFPVISARQFISAEDVDKAYGRHLRKDQYSFAPKILTVDPAWDGDDDLVIAIRQGLAFRILRVIPKNDNDIQIANIVALLEDEEQADGVIIDFGYGTGIKSAGDTMGRKWVLVKFSSSSPDPGYLNMRAYIWGRMKSWIKEGGAIPEDSGLYDEIVSPETVPRTDGIIQLESKKDMKAKGLPSPNKADALALSFAYEIKKKERGPAGRSGARYANTEYSPI